MYTKDDQTTETERVHSFVEDGGIAGLVWAVRACVHSREHCTSATGLVRFYS